MCFQCVCRNGWIVAPDFVQQHIPTHGRSGSLKIFEDICFLFRQPNAFLSLDKHFRAWTKSIGPNPVDRLFARAVAAQMRIDSRHQDIEAERLGYD